MDDLKAEIEKIVGCNSEVTNDTHDELCEQIYDLVQRQSEQLSKRPNTSSTWECFTKEEKQQKGNV